MGRRRLHFRAMSLPPPAAGAPLQPGQPLPAARTQRAKRPSYFAPGMIVAALVLIAVAVGVLFLVRDDDSGLDTEGAANGLAAVLDDADFEGGIATLRRCPLGDEDDLVAAIADYVDLPDDLVDGYSESFAVEEVDGFPANLVCTVSETEDGSADPEFTGVVDIVAFEPPDDDLVELLEDSYPDDDVEVADARSLRGGEVYEYCTGEDESICGAFWLDADTTLAVGIEVEGDGAVPEDVAAALERVLPDMVDNLAAEG